MHHRHSLRSPRRGVAPPRNDILCGAAVTGTINCKLPASSISTLLVGAIFNRPPLPANFSLSFRPAPHCQACHSEPVRTLAWESVPLNISITLQSDKNRTFLEYGLPRRGLAPPRNDIFCGAVVIGTITCKLSASPLSNLKKHRPLPKTVLFQYFSVRLPHPRRIREPGFPVWPFPHRASASFPAENPGS